VFTFVSESNIWSDPSVDHVHTRYHRISFPRWA